MPLPLVDSGSVMAAVAFGWLRVALSLGRPDRRTGLRHRPDLVMRRRCPSSPRQPRATAQRFFRVCGDRSTKQSFGSLPLAVLSGCDTGRAVRRGCERPC